MRVRLAVEELGLTYLKLGQFMAMRYDLLPPEVCRELGRLFEEVSPLAPEVARRTVEAEVEGPLDDAFSHFEWEPLAAASVAQVHRAVTAAGEEVAVKVQRPELERVFHADIRNLRRVAWLVDVAGLFGRLSAEGMIAEFARWTLQELDFRIEGRTAERVRSDALPFEVVPRVHWQLTTRRMLTMDFVAGLSVSRVDELYKEGGIEAVHRRLPDLDLHESLRRMTHASLHQLFIAGFFHGDPHPGNVFFRNDNLVAFVDFGIFGALTELEREVVSGQIENIALGNIRESLRYYKKQLVATEDTDPRAFHQECLEILGAWYATAMDPSSPIEERHLAKFTGDMIDVSRRHGLRFGLNYLLFWRALNALNATLWQVDPSYDLMGELRAFFELYRPDPFERLRRVKEDPAWHGQAIEASFHSPERLRRLGAALRGNEVRWRVDRWETPGDERRHRQRARGLAAAAVAASLLVLAGAHPLLSTPAIVAAAAMAATAVWSAA